MRRFLLAAVALSLVAAACSSGDNTGEVASLAAAADDPTAGHGGTDLKTARHFVRAALAGGPVPIDVYRAIEYSLPGIVANRSAEQGGAPLPIPDLRAQPYSGTRFWDAVGLPDAEPQAEDS